MSTTTHNATAAQRQEIERLEQTVVNRERRRGEDFYCLELLSGQENPGRMYLRDLRDMTVVAHYSGGPVNFFVLGFDSWNGFGWGFVCLGNSNDAEYGRFYMPEVEKMWLPYGGVVERNQTWKPATIRELKEKLVYQGLLKNA